MKFTMTVFPGGGAILSTEEMLTRQMFEQVKETFGEWKRKQDFLLLAETTVVHSTEIELDIQDPDGPDA